MLKVEYLEISNVGPFFGAHKIPIQGDCTVLTGANDVGKSWVLRALQLFCNGESIGQSEANLSYLSSSSGAWSNDRGIFVRMGFKTDGKKLVQVQTQSATVQFRKPVGFEITFFPGEEIRRFEMLHADQTYFVKVSELPVTCVTFSDERLDEMVSLTKTTSPLTQKLLDSVFGSEQPFQKVLASLRSAPRMKRINVANKRLAQILQELSPTLDQRLIIVEESSDVLRIDVEESGDLIPLMYRSEGFKRYLSIRLQTYFGLKREKAATLLVLDEPERSLHPDAQHFLRAALEYTASASPLQVVYATHSPSMINRMRPLAVRVVKRDVSHDIDLDERFAHSVVESYRPGDNFQRIRTALGVTAADSLLYGPITVVTEGDTELRCLMTILERLADSPEREAALNLIVLLDGQGTPSFLNWCHRVQSFGCTPIAFADGDKRQEIERFYAANDFTFEKIILEEDEFEDLLDREFYFACLSKVAGVECSYGEYSAWAASDTTTLMRPFSKRVSAWIETSYPEVRFSKQDVMVKAVEDDFELQFWNLDPFKSLLDTILNVASRLCLLPVVPSAEAEEELRANE